MSDEQDDNFSDEGTSDDVSDVSGDFDDEPPEGHRPRRSPPAVGDSWPQHLAIAGAALALVLGIVLFAMLGAKQRLDTPEVKAKVETPVAAPSDLGFCTDSFKAVLRRVLDSCGLLTANSRRGCTPGNVKQIAAISDSDFNALFSPLSDRAGILEFPAGDENLSPEATALLNKKWIDSRGASIFLVVARASPDGSSDVNQALSHKRANSVLFHLQQQFKDPELEQKLGLLWLGEEYAQLPKDFCKWDRAGVAETCGPSQINRSAFVSWIDCAL